MMLIRRYLTCVLAVTLASALLSPVTATAQAEDPIVGRWGVGSFVVDVSPTSSGFQGTVVESSAESCAKPGSNYWTINPGSGGHYTGDEQWYSLPCSPRGRGATVFDLSPSGTSMHTCSTDPLDARHTFCTDLTKMAPGPSPSISAAPSPSPSPSPTGPLCQDRQATITGTEGDDSLIGTRGSDIIAGGNGADTIDGAGGNDFICGGLGDDTIISFRGGTSELVGGDGNDWVHYSPTTFSEKLEARLPSNEQPGRATYDGVHLGEKATGEDALFSIENLKSPDSGHAYLMGGEGPNVLQGGNGFDTFEWSPYDTGADTWDGGEGSTDTVSFKRAPAGVKLDLAAGTSSVGDDTDTVLGIEDGVGSFFDDELVGDDGPNLLYVAWTEWAVTGDSNQLPGAGATTAGGGPTAATSSTEGPGTTPSATPPMEATVTSAVPATMMQTPLPAPATTTRPRKPAPTSTRWVMETTASTQGVARTTTSMEDWATMCSPAARGMIGWTAGEGRTSSMEVRERTFVSTIGRATMRTAAQA